MKTHMRWQLLAEEHVEIRRPGAPSNSLTQGSLQAAPQRRTDAWRALEHDWLRLATRPESHERMDGWKRMVPELNDFDSPADLLETIARPGSPERSCSLLGGLLVAARNDAFAAHTVLVALIPGLLIAAGRRWRTARHDGPWANRTEVDIDAISAAWEAINIHAGERHELPARLIIRRVERYLRTIQTAYHRHLIRSVQRPDAHAEAEHCQADGDAVDDLFNPTIVEALRSGRLDPTTADLVYRVVVLDQRFTRAGRRHGLDRRQTLGALRLALRVIAADENAAPTNRVVPQEVQQMSPPTPRPGDRAIRQSETALPVMPLLLTVKQAADLLGMGRSTVYELIDAGELRSVKRGASRRIPLKAIHEYIDRLLADNDGTEERSAVRTASWDRSVARGS
jgi:excisionase family DNA binding protein